MIRICSDDTPIRFRCGISVRVLKNNPSGLVAGHDLYSGLARDLLDETDVAPHIEGSEVDEGIDPRRLECFQLPDSAGDQAFPATE